MADDALATVEVAAKLLGCCVTVRQRDWGAAGAGARLAAARSVESLRANRDTDLDAVLTGVAQFGPDPLLAAATLMTRSVAHDHTSDPSRIEVVRVARAALPTELAEIVNQVSRRVSVFARWQTLPDCSHMTVADAHVHSGGVSPPAVLLRALLRHLSEVPAEGLSLPLKDAVGLDFDAEPILLATGISGIALQFPALCADLQRRLPVLGLSASGLWSEAMRLATSPDPEKVESLRRGFENAIYLGVAQPDLAVILRAGADWLRGALAPEEAELARGCVGALTLLHSSLVTPAWAHLDLFVERFELLRRLRRLGGQEEADRIEDSLRYLLSGGRLARVELRKTARSSVAAEGGLPRRDAYAGIVEDVKLHAEAIRRVRVQHPDLAAQMPVSFLRHRPTHGELMIGHVGLRYPIMDALAVANGVARACLEPGGAREFIGSLDVVGRESDTPNWVFSLAFGYVDQALKTAGLEPLGYSVHAGEQFAYPLDGLRRIGELEYFGVEVTRVGHALALSPGAAVLAAPPGPTSAATALEALLWAALRSPEVRSAVGELCCLLGSCVFAPADPSLEELLEWFVARFDYTRMQAVGLVPMVDSPFAYIAPAEESVPLGALRLTSLVDRMIAASAITGVADGVAFDEKRLVPQSLRDSVRASSRHSYDACLQHVRDEFVTQRLIECCPSSNIALGRLDGFSQHPIGEFRAGGLRVTVSSDDPGIFGALVEEDLVSLYHSGVLGSSADAGRAIREIVAASMAATAPGISPERCGALVEVLSG